MANKFTNWMKLNRTGMIVGAGIAIGLYILNYLGFESTLIQQPLKLLALPSALVFMLTGGASTFSTVQVPDLTREFFFSNPGVFNTFFFAIWYLPGIIMFTFVGGWIQSFGRKKRWWRI